MTHGYTSQISDAELAYALEAGRARVFKDVLDSIRRDQKSLSGDALVQAQAERAALLRGMLTEALRLEPSLAPALFEAGRKALQGRACRGAAPV